MILAVPALDATFVVAKRIKYRRPVYSADRWHFHHRLGNVGFSQRRTVLYLYGWTLSLAALALALRFVPYSEDDGTLNAGWTAVMLAFGAIAVAASVYLVVVLEILKFKRFRERELRRQVETGEMPALSEDDRARDRARAETGEFEAVRPPRLEEGPLARLGHERLRLFLLPVAAGPGSTPRSERAPRPRTSAAIRARSSLVA